MKPKTYKREVAVAMLLALAGVFIWGVFNERAMQAAGYLTMPVFAFAAGAFAIDAVFKQGGRSFETPS
ncbi:hypothetical protein [Marinobacterium sp. xm-d-509]|uniref:hypothetical protein n=1 Tax=Marinobacterium sp. xm-d-509 TaxID=2497739 RepID=UPI001569A087|nr:hypothetical protein [Marinobacterium sp. xm-d-509]NRP84100.1 hypothetical protein [Marinobacterium sp. xm-d-509]